MSDLHLPDRTQLDAARIRQQVNDLPALPQAAAEALAMLQEDDVRNEECAGRIASDQALSARMLRLANSAFYGVPGRVATVHDALNILGRRTTSSVLTAALVSTQLGRPRCEGFDFSDYWKHALGSAVAAQWLARSKQLDEGTAFTAGLMHDIGQLALAVYYPQELASVIAQAHSQDLLPEHIEHELLQVDHAEIGLWIATHWRFPPAVVDAIGGHHHPAAQACASITDVVHVADAVVHALDLSHAEHEHVPWVDMATWNRVGVSTADYPTLFKRTEDGVQALCAVLDL